MGWAVSVYSWSPVSSSQESLALHILEAQEVTTKGVCIASRVLSTTVDSPCQTPGTSGRGRGSRKERGEAKFFSPIETSLEYLYERTVRPFRA